MIYDIQKASILKRISAWLLDAILVGILTVFLMFILSWIVGLDKYHTQLQQTTEKWAREYNIDFDITEEQFDKLTKEEQIIWNTAYDEANKGLPENKVKWERKFVVDFNITKEQYDNKLTDEERKIWDTAYDGANKELSENKALSMVYSLTFVCFTIGLLLSFVILNFVLPLVLFKNGRTLGMKVFNLGVVFTNSVRINAFALFVRSILGQFTLETMVPVFIVFLVALGQLSGFVGLFVLVGLLILQLVLVIATKTNSLVHDVISNTVVVDMSLQMVFDDYDALVSYKEEVAQAAAEKAEYK